MSERVVDSSFVFRLSSFVKRRKPVIFFALLITLYSLLFTITGCAPTYPKESFKESILKLCKKEYKLDVKVETIGKTVAAYVPLEDLIDFNFAISKKASDKINDVILSISRVALSTDAKYDFYCIIAHDVRIPEIQIVIVKSVDDVKRFLLNDISRTEYAKRMLIDIRMSPQAQKERKLKEIFDRMLVDSHAQEQVMSDFFRSEPAALGDIGYWNDHFYIKDVQLSEFLAEQIASRIRFEFRDNKDLSDIFLLKSAKDVYESRNGKMYFRIEIEADPKLLKDQKGEVFSGKVFNTALNMAAVVLHGYQFNDFDYVTVVDQTDNKSVDVSRERLEEFRKKKLKLEEIVK